MTFAIKVVPNKRRPHEYYLMRDLTDHVVHVWTRKSEAERVIAAMDKLYSCPPSKFTMVAVDSSVKYVRVRLKCHSVIRYLLT